MTLRRIVSPAKAIYDVNGTNMVEWQVGPPTYIVTQLYIPLGGTIEPRHELEIDRRTEEQRVRVFEALRSEPEVHEITSTKALMKRLHWT